MKPNRIPLGSWRCPSGNGVDVALESPDGHTYHVLLAWDDPPPFADPADSEHYVSVILPQVKRLVEERALTPGRALLVVGL